MKIKLFRYLDMEKAPKGASLSAMINPRRKNCLYPKLTIVLKYSTT
ncbi:conserved hypothetical protein (plasmid) [Borreliella burgdorferi CA-11.2A]|nr:conserved hypothetical protein [Borreliella burgdorferi 64b]ACN55460.1 conserved hypothetical protein [Borreliella burgdorferi WI91-23]ACN56250.1 conserved hypothetical protein [Borreliella burgdorferi CA-11.2A]